MFAASLSFLAIMLGLYCYSQIKFRKVVDEYPPEGKFITIEGVRLHYLDAGEGRPIVFLHGGVLEGSDFRQVMDLAAASGYRALAFDRPGYGHSRRLNDKRLTPSGQAKLLHKALEAIGIDKPIIVGHSWSGILVLAYALKYPKALSGMVTLAAGTYKEGYPAEKGDVVSKLALMPVIGDLILNTLLTTLGNLMARQMLKVTFAPEPVPSRYEKKTLALWLRPSQFKANREDVLAFVPEAEQLSKRYPAIRTPAVIVVGAQDPFPTKDHSYRLHRELPFSTLIELPQAAHMIPHNRPEDVVTAVQTLIREYGI